VARGSQVTVSYPKGRSPRGMAGRVKEAREAGLVAGLIWWHVRVRPKHFTAAGARQYGYSPRGEKYTKFKSRKYKHSRPMVLTGLLEASMARQPSPRLSGKSGELPYTGLPWYTKVYQKASMTQIYDALAANDGDLKAAARQLKMNAERVRGRVKSGVDMHEGDRKKRWRLAQEQVDALGQKFAEKNLISEWEAKAKLAREVFAQSGKNLKEAANAMGVSMSTFGKYLRNPGYQGRAVGQTANKVKEILTVTPDEVAVMGRVIGRRFREVMAGG